MKIPKIINSVIIASLILSLCSCGNSGSSVQPDDSADVTEQTAENKTTADEITFLPAGFDLCGETYSILHGQTINEGDTENEVTYDLADLSGDIIQDSVYNRTRMTEEKLNIKITSRHIEWGELGSYISKSVLADDHEFDAICGRMKILSAASINSMLYDLKKIGTLALNSEWWDQGVNSSVTVYGKQYLATGDFNYYDDYSVGCMYFNKKHFENRNIPEPYQLVRDGSWIFDEFYSIIKDAAEDLNGDGVFDENDFYGYVANLALLSSMMSAFGEQLIFTDADGNMTLNTTVSIINKAQMVADAMLNNDSVLIEERKLGYEKGDLIFPNGQALMTQGLIGGIQGYRSLMEDDFGVLPYPKYEQEQEGYHCISSEGWASAISVPVNCRYIENIGYILDTMGYYSIDTVTEAVIETTIMNKGIRDTDSEEMLRIVFKSKFFDTSCVYDWGIYGTWCDMTFKTNPEIASSLAKKETSIGKTLENVVDIFAELP